MKKVTLLISILFLLLLAACGNKDQNDEISSTDDVENQSSVLEDDVEEEEITVGGEGKSERELSELEKDVELFINDYFATADATHNSYNFEKELLQKFYEMKEYAIDGTDIEASVSREEKRFSSTGSNKNRAISNTEVAVIEITNESAKVIEGVTFMEVLADVRTDYQFYDADEQLDAEKGFSREYTAHIYVAKTDKAKHGFLLESIHPLDD